jgi:hypothetical protein
MFIPPDQRSHCGENAKLLHEAQGIKLSILLYYCTTLDAIHVESSERHPPASRWSTLEFALLGTRPGNACHHPISLGNDILDIVMEIGEGREEHGVHLLPPLFAQRFRVTGEVETKIFGEQLVSCGKVSFTALIKKPQNERLVCFC